MSKLLATACAALVAGAFGMTSVGAAGVKAAEECCCGATCNCEDCGCCKNCKDGECTDCSECTCEGCDCCDSK